MGDGQTTEYNFNFPYFDETNITVTINNQQTYDFSIIATEAGENADMPYIGGTVIFNSAPSTTDNITIARKLSLERTIDYQPTALIDPTILNQDMNYTIEVLKDFQNDLEKIKTLSGDPDKIQEMLLRLDSVSQQINSLGDITQIRNNIETVDTRTNGLTDYVIDSQIPTAENNYTWYRKYKSGWVEQGGQFIGENFYQFPQTMANTNYLVTTACQIYTAQIGTAIILYDNPTTTGITLQGRVDGAGNNSVRGCWTIQGFSAA